MRVGVLDLALGEQRPGPGQLLDDGTFAGPSLPSAVTIASPPNKRQVLAVAAVGLDVIGHLQRRMFRPDLIVVVAVARRGMNEARCPASSVTWSPGSSGTS